MTVRFIEGFDPYPSVAGVLGVEGRWVVSNTASFSMVSGRFGGQGIRNSAAATISAAFEGVPTSVGTVGVAYQVNASPSALTTIFTVRDVDNNVQFSLAMDQLGRMFTYRGAVTGGTFLAQADVTLTVGVWYYVEIEFSIGTGGAGFTRVYVNGSKVIDYIGNTQGVSGVNTAGRISLFGGSHTMTFDDIYVTDVSTRLGECRVEPLRPNADTAVKGFAPNAGVENYSRVNEVLTDGDVSYVYSSLVGAEDLYEVDNLSVNPQNIFAVQTRVVARKDDVATRAIKAGLKSGATTTYGSDFFLSSSYTTKVDIYETDPDTAAPWTKTGLDGIQIGQKITI